MKENELQFNVAWAQMPMRKEQLELIEIGHRRRPYLLCMDMESYYYAFPCTSKIYSNNTRYENEKVVFESALSNYKSLAILAKVDKLPYENICSHIYDLNQRYNNEIIKKINACSQYSDYPKEFEEYFSNFNYSLDLKDLIELDEQLYFITNQDEKDFIVSKVYPFPVKNTSIAFADGLKYYISDESYKLDKNGSYKYRSHINYYDNTGQALIKKEQKDYSKLYNLEPGMIIKYDDNKMVVLENCITDLFVLSGKDGNTYSTFETMTIPVDTKIDYKIDGFLQEERLVKLINKTNEKIENKKTYKRNKN